MVEDNQKNNIGLLDSGVGGLSVLSELYKVMPNKNYLFFGDTKNVPYGTKTFDEIFKYTKNILDFFISRNVKNAVFACNTTSALVYEELKNTFKDKIRIFPLIQSVAQEAIRGMYDETIAILATKATINSHKYEEEIYKYNKHVKIIGIDCSGFVEIVENRLYDEIDSYELIKSKLQIAKDNNAKRIVLGCTHYPYLLDIFKKIYNVEYFNPAKSLANIVQKELGSTQVKNPKMEFCVSKDPEEFILSSKTFFDVKNVELIKF